MGGDRALNIRNVSPALMEKLKSNATKKGLTLRDYCIGVLSKARVTKIARRLKPATGRKPSLEAGRSSIALGTTSPSRTKAVRRAGSRGGSRPMKPKIDRAAAGHERRVQSIERTGQQTRIGPNLHRSPKVAPLVPPPIPKKAKPVNACPRCRSKLKRWGPTMMRCTVCEQNYPIEQLERMAG
jgi:hypothetical protein